MLKTGETTMCLLLDVTLVLTEEKQLSLLVSQTFYYLSLEICVGDVFIDAFRMTITHGKGAKWTSGRLTSLKGH